MSKMSFTSEEAQILNSLLWAAKNQAKHTLETMNPVNPNQAAYCANVIRLADKVNFLFQGANPILDAAGKPIRAQ